VREVSDFCIESFGLGGLCCGYCLVGVVALRGVLF